LAPERIVAVVLAAGAGRRFGGRKQLAGLRGRPLLEHALAAAAAGPGETTVLVLGADADEVERGIELGGAAVVRCPDWERGQGASLRAGLAALGPEVAAALVTLGDEPFVAPAASRRLVAARRSGLAALRATYGDRPGHPVLIERPLFETLRAAAPEVNPAALLREAGVEAVECGDLGDPADVDTPAQLAALENPEKSAG
jgi:molybdenum cofactor cytidylyltransferase